MKEKVEMKALAVLLVLVCLSLAGCVNLTGDMPSLLDRPIIKMFNASPPVIEAGEVSTLSWTVNGANSVYIDQGVGNVALNGFTTVSPLVSTTYTLTANNAAGNSSARCQVMVKGSAGTGSTGGAGAPVINSFKAEPASISEGSYTVLSWDVTGATSLDISPDVGQVEPGISLMVYPSQTTRYIFTAMNSAGQAVTALTVVVIPSEQPQLLGEQEVTLPLLIGESGSLIKSSPNYTKSGAVCIGDTSMNLPSRAFLSYDISSIPADAVIHETVFDLGNYTVIGNPVYSISGWGNMGALEVYQYQYGSTADMGRLVYESATTALGSFKLVDTTGEPLSLDVTMDSGGNNMLEGLIADGQSRCQLRLQFFTTTNWDSQSDMVCVETAVLRVRYSVPQ